MHNFKMIHLGRVDQALLQDLAQVDQQIGLQDEASAGVKTVAIDGFYQRLQLVQNKRQVDVELPAIQRYLASMAGERRQMVSAVQLSWLPPGSHERRRVVDEERTLYCLMLQGQRGMVVESGDERVQMRPGELWQITQGDLIKVGNDSQDGCVMLYIELQLGLGLPQYQSAGRDNDSWYPHALAG